MGNILFAQNDPPFKSLKFNYYTKKIENGKNIGWSYSERSLIREGKGDYKGAIADMEKAIETEAWAVFYKILADFYLDYESDTLKAIENYHTNLQYEPNYLLSIIQLNNIYLAQDKEEKARIGIKRGSQIDSMNTDLLIQKAVYQLRIKDSVAANITITQIDKKEKAKASELSYYAYDLIEKGHPKDAIFLYNKAISLHSYESSYYGNRGWAYFLIGNLEACISDSKKSIELDKKAYFAGFNWAIAELCSGNLSQSKALFETYFSLSKKASKINGDEAIQGSISDLKNLIEQGKKKEEALHILETIFQIHI